MQRSALCGFHALAAQGFVLAQESGQVKPLKNAARSLDVPNGAGWRQTCSDRPGELVW